MEMNGEQQLDAGIGFGEQNLFFRVHNYYYLPTCVMLSDIFLTLNGKLFENMSYLSLYLAENLALGSTHKVC